mmetsp:Transcript_19943/g.25694  ORF Transcript_19943/g.25694 Transcript_19943/m.25694 type:complete len:384 (-) Transcript_19943:197-1348(-)
MRHGGSRRSGVLRRWLVGHGSSRISGLLVELDWLESRSRWSTHIVTTTSSTAATSLDRSTTPTSLLLRHDTIWHWVSPTSLLLLTHHRISSLLLRNPTTAPSWATHHLRHHLRIRRLHATARSWSLHVHGHARVSHWTTHRGTHHAGLARPTRSSTVRMLSFKLSPSDFPALGNCYKDWLGGNKFAVHFIDSTSCFFGSREANKTKTTGSAILHVLHDTGRSDCSHGGKFIAKHVIRNIIVKILHIQIHSLELGNSIHFLSFKLGTKFSFTLSFLLCATYIKFLFGFFAIDRRREFFAIQRFHGGSSRLVLSKVDKPITQTDSDSSSRLSSFIGLFLLFAFLLFTFLLFAFRVSSASFFNIFRSIRLFVRLEIRFLLGGSHRN